MNVFDVDAGKLNPKVVLTSDSLKSPTQNRQMCGDTDVARG